MHRSSAPGGSSVFSARRKELGESGSGTIRDNELSKKAHEERVAVGQGDTQRPEQFQSAPGGDKGDDPEPVDAQTRGEQQRSNGQEVGCGNAAEGIGAELIIVLETCELSQAER